MIHKYRNGLHFKEEEMKPMNRLVPFTAMIHHCLMSTVSFCLSNSATVITAYNTVSFIPHYLICPQHLYFQRFWKWKHRCINLFGGDICFTTAREPWRRLISKVSPVSSRNKVIPVTVQVFPAVGPVRATGS